MEILIVTVVHHPLEPRLHRQTRALTEAGHHVRLAAPWHAYDAVPPAGASAIDVPPARGRSRLVAAARARRYLRDHARTADVVLLADPELVPAAMAVCPDRAVWDVRDDIVTAAAQQEWVPRVAPGAVRLAMSSLERVAERRLRVLLADHAHARRFAQPHPVIPDLPWVPKHVDPPDERRVVHVGHHSRDTGAAHLLALAASLPEDVTLEAIGPADDEVRPLLQQAVDDGLLTWSPFLPHEQVLARLDGAAAGLSLLPDGREPHRWQPHSLYEYMSRGVPIVATTTPITRELVHTAGAGLIVPHGDLAALRRAITWLLGHDRERRQLGERGHTAAQKGYDWAPHATRFVALLEDIPKGGTSWASEAS